MATKIDSIPIEIQKLLEKAHSNCEFRKLFSVNVESIPRSQSLVPLSVLIPSLRQPNTCCVGVLSGMRVWPSGTDDFAIESIFVSLGLPAELPNEYQFDRAKAPKFD